MRFRVEKTSLQNSLRREVTSKCVNKCRPTCLESAMYFIASNVLEHFQCNRNRSPLVFTFLAWRHIRFRFTHVGLLMEMNNFIRETYIEIFYRWVLTSFSAASLYRLVDIFRGYFVKEAEFSADRIICFQPPLKCC